MNLRLASSSVFLLLCPPLKKKQTLPMSIGIYCLCVLESSLGETLAVVGHFMKYYSKLDNLDHIWYQKMKTELGSVSTRITQICPTDMALLECFCMLLNRFTLKYNYPFLPKLCWSKNHAGAQSGEVSSSFQTSLHYH